MPTIFTQGAASAQGFGFAGKKPVPVIGNQGIFAIGAFSITTNKYIFSCCINLSATSLSGCMYQGTAAGNSTRGIFCLGYFCGATKRSKYIYTTNATSCVAAASTTPQGSTAAGNSTRGIFQLNGSTNVRNKYTYACDTSSSGASAPSTLAGATRGAAGNSIAGIFFVGGSATQKYSYASCFVASSTNLSGCSSNGGAAGNATTGIFLHGNYNSATSKYLYSCETVSTGSTLPKGSIFPFGTSSSCKAVFAYGYSVCPPGNAGAASPTAARLKYIYASSSFASATSASSSSNSSGATINGVCGVNL